jgi:hypothetical protein
MAVHTPSRANWLLPRRTQDQQSQTHCLSDVHGPLSSALRGKARAKKLSCISHSPRLITGTTAEGIVTNGATQYLATSREPAAN